jgi:hypothetical protein
MGRFLQCFRHWSVKSDVYSSSMSVLRKLQARHMLPHLNFLLHQWCMSWTEPRVIQLVMRRRSCFLSIYRYSLLVCLLPKNRWRNMFFVAWTDVSGRRNVIDSFDFNFLWSLSYVRETRHVPGIPYSTVPVRSTCTVAAGIGQSVLVPYRTWERLPLTRVRQRRDNFVYGSFQVLMLDYY